MPELVFLRRGDEVLRVLLDRPRLVLGRGEQSDVVLPDPEISRKQVLLTQEADGIWARDLSGKGTWISGKRVEHAQLVDGGDIQLGQWRAVFRAHVSHGGEGASATRVDGTRTEALPSLAAPENTDELQLRLRRGGTDTVHHFKGDSVALGKDANNDIVVDDPFVSGRHLKLSKTASGFHLSDRQSTNGTFIGLVRLYEADVPLRTALRIGETELSVESSNERRGSHSFFGMVGSESSMRELAELIERVAPSRAAVAVFGESGTGKELVAHAIHTLSPRAAMPFIPVNCAAISRELIESELFGHEKGAFTGANATRRGAFEEAHSGTLFLDEVGELPLDLQAKLLRALESGEIKRVGAARPIQVDTRIVAATNRDLLAATREGRFREDLYYRLCVVPLHLPPLRSRRNDISLLVSHFTHQFSPRGQNIQVTPSAMERLKTHAWPGNVRELRNVIHRALLLRRGPHIDADDLSFDPERSTEINAPAIPQHIPGMTLDAMLEKLERQIVESALKRYGNNRERVARELGVARSTLFKRLKDWGLTRQDEQADTPEA